MVMEYAHKYFVDIMNWIYVRYGQITPRDLMKNQGTIQETYHAEDPI